MAMVAGPKRLTPAKLLKLVREVGYEQHRDLTLKRAQPTGWEGRAHMTTIIHAYEFRLLYWLVLYEGEKPLTPRLHGRAIWWILQGMRANADPLVEMEIGLADDLT